MLKAVYPEYKWLPWLFTSMPKSIAHDPQIIVLALEFLEKALNLEKPEDWYRVRAKQLQELKIWGLVEKNGSLSALLEKYRPEFQWDVTKFRNA
jgi:hypothetical protein